MLIYIEINYNDFQPAMNWAVQEAEMVGLKELIGLLRLLL